MDNNKTYIHILINTLAKKNQILNELLSISELQKQYLSGNIDDIEKINFFDETIEKKDNYIQQLTQLDDGFEAVYERVKEEIAINKMEHKQEILQLQDLIKEITNKNVKLQALEKQNKLKFDISIVNSKQEIKDYKKSNQSVAEYYKNMSNQFENESYFIDKKK